jgi:hypothetical protein
MSQGYFTGKSFPSVKKYSPPPDILKGPKTAKKSPAGRAGLLNSQGKEKRN